MYRQGDLVIHGIANEQPVFAIITHFISTEIEHFFVLRLIRTLGYCYHYHAYKVDTGITGSKCCVCTQTDLKDYHPLSVVHSFDNTLLSNNFVSLKYHVF